MLKLFGRSSVILLLLSVFLYADGTFKMFRTFQQKSNDATFRKFETVQKHASNASEFFSSQQWNSYEPLPFKKLYESEKPKNITSLKERKVKAVGPKIRIVLGKRQKYQEPVSSKVPKDIIIDFFTTMLSFNIPEKLKDAKFKPQTQMGISNFYTDISYADYSYFINEIEKIKKNMNLNDWGLYLLVQKISNKIFSNKDDAKLFIWFIFNKMNYSIRAGVVKKHILLVFRAKQSVNYTQYYKIDNKLFYAIDSKAEKGVIYTYAKDAPNSDKEFDFSLNTLPNLSLDIQTKKLTFKQETKIYTFDYRYNQNLIDFMATYPQVQSNVFLNTPLDDISYQSIGKNLKDYVDRKKASIALNFVLHFVQNSFKYQADIDQFKKEKFMFAQETLYYDKSDAEDRVSLFSYLIRKFFSFNVIGVKYKDHMVTGLYIPILGDSVMYKKKKYIVSDPTYSNANVGQSVSKYKLLKPVEFIKLKQKVKYYQ